MIVFLAAGAATASFVSIYLTCDGWNATAQGKIGHVVHIAGDKAIFDSISYDVKKTSVGFSLLLDEAGINNKANLDWQKIDINRITGFYGIVNGAGDLVDFKRSTDRGCIKVMPKF